MYVSRKMVTPIAMTIITAGYAIAARTLPIVSTSAWQVTSDAFEHPPQVTRRFTGSNQRNVGFVKQLRVVR